MRTYYWFIKQTLIISLICVVSKRCYEREVTLPECSDLKIRIMDYDRIRKNELIGETTIDIESRYYSKYRPRCGLPNRYNKYLYESIIISQLILNRI